MNQLRKKLSPEEVNCVVYHHRCGDGFGGAYAFWKFVKESGVEDPTQIIDFVPYSHLYNESFVRRTIIPKIKNKNVVYVDVCPPKELFNDMLILPNKAIVLDHHESAVKTTEDFPKDLVYEHCFIDQTHSGATLAHQFCFPDTEPPLFIRCIEDRDLWAWKLEDISRPFTEAFYGRVPFEFEAYEKYEDEENVKLLVKEGKILTMHRDIKLLDTTRKALETKININNIEYAVYVINTTDHISEIGNLLSRMRCERLDQDCDFAMMWYYDHLRDKIKVSLRSDNTRENPMNVREIASHFGGGGHPSAAGFSLNQPHMFLKAPK